MPAGSLGLYRIGYCLLVILVVGIPYFSWLSDKPELLFDPPTYSLANLVSEGFPGVYFFRTLDALIVISFALLLLGIRATLVSRILFGLLVIGFSYSNSLGKISHESLLMVITPLLMSFSNWGSHFSVGSLLKKGARPPERYWPVTFLAILLGFAMFSAGLPKLLYGWLSFDSQAVHRFLYAFYYQQERVGYLTPHLLEIQNPWFWEPLDYGGVFFELLFIFAVARAKVFRGFILAAILFHAMNLLIFNINFIDNLVLYLLFLDWRPVLYFVHRTNETLTFSVQRLLAFAGGFTLAVSIYYLGGNVPLLSRALNLLSWDESAQQLVVVLLAAALFAYNYFYSITHARHSFSSQARSRRL